MTSRDDCYVFHMKPKLCEVNPRDVQGYEHRQDEVRVRRYARAMKNGWPEAMPPVPITDYGDGAYTLLDGHHRWRAALSLGLVMPAVLVDSKDVMRMQEKYDAPRYEIGYSAVNLAWRRKRRTNPESVRFDRIAPLNYKRLFPGEQWRVWIPAEKGSTTSRTKPSYSIWRQGKENLEAKGFADVFLDGDTLHLAYLWVDDAFRSQKIGSRIVEAIYQHEPWRRVRYIVWGELHHDATRKMYRDFLVLDGRTCGGKFH